MICGNNKIQFSYCEIMKCVNEMIYSVYVLIWMISWYFISFILNIYESASTSTVQVQADHFFDTHTCTCTVLAINVDVLLILE